MAELTPADYNPRVISPNQLRRLKASISEHTNTLAGWSTANGFRMATTITVNRNGNRIVGGHQRVEALRALGQDWIHEADITWVDIVPGSATEKALNVALNNREMQGDWDGAKLAQVLADIKFEAGVVYEGLEFSLLEDLTTELLAEDQLREGHTDPDAIPEPPDEAVSRPGEVYALGPHRLMCGDSTKAGDVSVLMAGKNADLCFTSPPYGQQRDYTPESQELLSDWDGLMRGVFSNLPMSAEGQVLVNLGLIHRDGEWQPYWDGWIEWMRGQGWRRFGWYIWDQGAGLVGDWNGRLGPSHEFVFHFNQAPVRPVKFVETKESSRKRSNLSRGALRDKNGKVKGICSPDKLGQATRIPDSVIRISRNATVDMARNNHPATFPIQLPAFMMRCWPGLIYEPFCGSGSTIMAAEQRGRVCYGMEISPLYCDVIRRRWAEFVHGPNCDWRKITCCQKATV